MSFIETHTSYKETSTSRIINLLNGLITIIELSCFLTFGGLILWALFYGVASFILLLTSLWG